MELFWFKILNSKIIMTNQTKLLKACSGKSGSQGGMNLSEIKALAVAAGHSGVGNREALLKVICKKAQSPQPIQSLQKKQTKQTKEFQKPIKPSLPRGQVTLNTKYWTANDKPESKAERELLMKTCGPKCFLIPEELKYPICSKKNDCKINCDGLRAAYDVATIVTKSKRVKGTFKQTAERALRNTIEPGKAYCKWI
jgi:hypothetical protein